MTDITFDQLCELFAYTPKGRPLDSREVAAILQVHPNTMEQYRLRREGPRFFSRPGTRRVWYAERDVLAWRRARSAARASKSRRNANPQTSYDAVRLQGRLRDGTAE